MHRACEDNLICYTHDFFFPPFLEPSEVQLLRSNFYLKLLRTSEFPPDLLAIAWVSAIQQLGNSIFKNEMAKRLHAEEKADFQCHRGRFSFYKYWPISHSAEHVCSVGCISPQQIAQTVSQGFQISYWKLPINRFLHPVHF